MSTPPWTPFERATPIARDAEQQKLIATYLEGHELWKNNQYQVVKVRISPEGEPPAWHLSIKRLDRAPIRDWRAMQRIKNELVGPEAEGVELYPAESRLVDTANQYHLWVFEGQQLPFGFRERMVSDEPGIDGAVQRAFGEDERPADAKTAQQLAWELHKATKRMSRRRGRK